MKAILLSINPEHALNILKGQNIRTSKRVPKGFIGWVYVYVTKGKDFLSVVHEWKLCMETLLLI